MPRERYEIYNRIFLFVVNVVKSTRLLVKNEENKIILNQLLRSVTSMGANAEEADGSSTSREFIHCFTIVRKEGKETIFWLKLLSELNEKQKDIYLNLVPEAEQLVAIVSKIISKSRNK